MSKKKKNIPLPRIPEGVSLFDTHCHLDMDDYREDQNEVISRAAQGGVTRIVTVGIDLESSSRAIAIAGRHEGVYATIGVHPHNVSGLGEDTYLALKRIARSPKVVAYGEIGMDLVRLHAPESVQKEHFGRQLLLARELNLPLIIHDREAHATILDILRSEAPFPAGGVMHCFSGDVALARQVLDLGFCISIPGVVTFNKAEIMQEVVRFTPIDALLLETDGPYLAPVPMRGRRNEPLYLVYIAQKIAELKGLSLEEVARHTTANGLNLFRLPGGE